MVKQMQTVQIALNARVAQISRQPSGGFLLTCEDRRRTRVDDLVLACSGPATLRLLDGVTGNRAQQTALAAIEFQGTRIAIHTDPAYAPSDPNNWSFLNSQVHNGYCEASMWLGKVLLPVSGMQSDLKLWKSWVTHRDRQPKNVIHQTNFQHMVPTVTSLQAQTRVLELQGQDGVWIAGGYTFPFDSQETALLSALKIAAGLNVTSARSRLFQDVAKLNARSDSESTPSSTLRG